VSNLYSVSGRTITLFGCSQRPSGLAQAGDSTAVWTRANDDVTCSLSDEPTPPLAPNRPLAAVILFVFSIQEEE